jgi:hypothetical protein
MSIASDALVVVGRVVMAPLSATREAGGGGGHTAILLGLGLSYHPTLI